MRFTRQLAQCAKLPTADPQPGHCVQVAASTRNMPAGSELLCGRFQPGSTNVVVAGSQTAWHVWDTRSAEQPQSHDAAGQMAIQALDISASAAHLLATGSRDGRVCLWDLRCGGPDSSGQYCYAVTSAFGCASAIQSCLQVL